MPEQILTQNWFSSHLTTPISVTSGDFQFTLTSPTTQTKGWLMIGSESNPDVVYFHNRVGNVYSVSGYNRRNAQTHNIDTPVRVGSPAEILNMIAKMIPFTFYAEVSAALTVTVFGWYYDLWGTTALATNKEITVWDNTVTYIWFRYFDQTIRFSTSSVGIDDPDHASYGQLLHTVTAALGTITSIVTQNTRQFNSANGEGVNTTTPTLSLGYIGALTTATLTPAAELAFHIPGDTLDSKTTVAIFAQYIKDAGLLPEGAYGYVHNQAVGAATWTIPHVLDSDRTIIQFYDNASPSWLLTPNNIIFNQNNVVVDWSGVSVSGFAVVLTSSGAQTTGSLPKVDLTAGEWLVAWDIVRMGIPSRDAGLNNSFIPPSFPTFETITSAKFGIQCFKALKADLVKIQLYLQKTAAPDSTTITVEIFATTTATVAGATRFIPTGAALATATSWAFTTTAGWTEFTLSPALTVTPWTHYAIKITATGAETVKIYYGDDTITGSVWYTYISDYTVIGDFAYKALSSASLVAETAASVYKASSQELATSYFVGGILSAISQGSPAKVQIVVCQWFTGLTPGTVPMYYLQDIPGTIASTVGTIDTPVGRPISTTSIRLKT